MTNLHGKTVLITGGGSGIGRACALQFARVGAKVLVGDKDRPAALATARLVSEATGGLVDEDTCFEFDVSNDDAVQGAMDRIFAASPPDILVNSAGIGATQPFLEIDVSVLDRMFGINLRGTFLCSQHVARRMVAGAKKGSIVNIGSASGIRGNAGRAAYGATKAAVANLTQVMAVELAQHGIRVNAVAPGPIETALVAAAHTQEVREAWLGELPIARYGVPEDVARAVLFLADPASAYITGHILSVDGGFAGAGILSA